MPRSRALVTLGVMLSLFLASMESTVVATAMPTIVSQLGGLAVYSWVFSAYLVASTTTVPIFGKLSDLFGRRPVFAVAMAFFLVGSLLCGRAGSMAELIGFRVVQGLGAGGVMTLAFTIVGAIFSFEQRARMQGLFSGMWGVSSIVGPLIGGFLVDQISWPWIFYINGPPGLVAAVIIWLAWGAEPRSAGPVRVDYLGAVLLAGAVVAFLLGLFTLRTLLGWALLGMAVVLCAALIRVERRAPEPILPLPLFRQRLFAVASAHGLFVGFAMFGSIAFVPLFVQAVRGTSATAAGATIMPFMLGWVTASIIGSRMLLRTGYRSLAVAGMTSLVTGAFLMSRIGAQTSHVILVIDLALMGIGMGLSIPSLTIAVQTAVARGDLGAATSTLQFARSIGGAVGVSIMGAILSLRLGASLRAAGVEPATVSLGRLLDPLARATPGALDVTLRAALAAAVRSVFVVAFVAAAAGFVATLLAPRGRLAQLAARGRDAAGAVGATPAEEHR